MDSISAIHVAIVLLFILNIWLFILNSLVHKHLACLYDSLLHEINEKARTRATSELAIMARLYALEDVTLPQPNPRHFHHFNPLTNKCDGCGIDAREAFFGRDVPPAEGKQVAE